jgi:hypothetical protein
MADATEVRDERGRELLEGTDFRREVRVTPSWDRRDPEPSKNYGIHGCDMYFLLTANGAGVEFQVGTSWLLPHLREEGHRSTQRGDTSDIALKVKYDPRGWNLSYHSPVPQYEGQAPSEQDCEVTGGICYSDGLYRVGDELLETLIAEGSEALWVELENWYREWFDERGLRAARAEIERLRGALETLTDLAREHASATRQDVDVEALSAQIDEALSEADAGPEPEAVVHHRTNIEDVDGGVRICRGEHDKHEPCEWETYTRPALPGETAGGAVLREIADERRRQEEKWGERDHPFERPGAHWAGKDGYAQRRCEEAGLAIGPLEAQGKCSTHARRGDLTWWDILIEEVVEAVADSHRPTKLRGELVQVAAVAAAMIECIDRGATPEQQEVGRG